MQNSLKIINQGDVVVVRFDPTEGREQIGTRPAVVISGDGINISLDICIVCLLTTKFKGLPGLVELFPNEQNNLNKVSNVMTFQIRTITKSRILRRIGTVDSQTINRIKKEVNNVLTY